MVCVRAGLQSDQAGVDAGHRLRHLARPTVRCSATLPCPPIPCILNMFLAGSIPTEAIFMTTSPLVIGTTHTFQFGTADASRVGGVLFIRWASLLFHLSERAFVRYQRNSIVIVSLIACFVSGCAKEPPKCSDEATFSLVRQIIADQLGGREGVTDKELQDNMRIEFPRPSAYDEKIKKITCEAKLIAGGTVEMPITYESQLDDKNQHIVSVGGISRRDLIALQLAIANGIQKGREVEKSGTMPQPRTALSPATSAASISGTWKGSLEGDGSMTVTSSATGFDVNLRVSSPSGCGGAIDGHALLANNVLTLTKKEADQVCIITIKFSGDTAELDENNCSYFHGAACGFSGTLNRQK